MLTLETDAPVIDQLISEGKFCVVSTIEGDNGEILCLWSSHPTRHEANANCPQGCEVLPIPQTFTLQFGML